ncbi:hypothetical protein COCMIDRAFT_92786 [Bipolaris oryzae ATCC 44560]|uniref:Uncharacterized protein n=1 Tax=Bipolaris oryzae ATCC 44560 TaxID=930090 RepID=W6Z3U6_COCMI|nr:uncharacterized protein COCMIDRAFT_92786 [Bipolaris oryzae ATCC 44560]EUC46422.1 hypothetical protein COCMIDRAFT_92786 [Bipolaris oryzae ATCC 44560]
MAPTPESPSPEASPTPTGSLKSQTPKTYWTKANIISTTIFIIICVLLLIGALSLFLYRRRQTKKHAAQKPDAAALLPDKDKANMFSRDRASSVTLYVDSLYVDSDADDRRKRTSTDTMHLVPLHITPVEEARDPLAGLSAGPGRAVTTDRAVSVGSSVSAVSSRTSQGSVLLSPVGLGEDADAGVRSVGRPRSTSTASTRSRYYERADVGGMPEVPRIVHTAV